MNTWCLLKNYIQERMVITFDWFLSQCRLSDAFVCICAGLHLTEGQPSEWADSQPRRTRPTPFWDYARWEALQIIAVLYRNQHATVYIVSEWQEIKRAFQNILIAEGLHLGSAWFTGAECLFVLFMTSKQHISVTPIRALEDMQLGHAVFFNNIAKKTE